MRAMLRTEMRVFLRRSTMVFGALVLLGLMVPAGATVHEITGMACSGGNAVTDPPGISKEGSANFAKPLLASGAIRIEPVAGGGIVFVWNEDKPSLKVTNGQLIQLEPGVWFHIPIWDPSHPSANCTNWTP